MKILNNIDYLRAFSMLYIVGFWHLFEYTDAFPGYSNPFTRILTLIVLGLFVFMSGFLIGSTRINTSNLIYFYKKRLIRIYPLYVFAVILFYVYGINDAEKSIKSLVFISMYSGPFPLTLWFITMLFLFYLVTPLLLKLADNPIKYMSFIVSILLVNAVLFVTIKAVDIRVLLYFPIFSIGIYCSRHGLKTRIINIRCALLLLFAGVILTFIDMHSWTLNTLKVLPIIISCSYLIFVISYFNEHKFKKIKFVRLLSYSSFAMYLFHRPVYITMMALFFPERGQFQVLYLVTICLFTVLLISWSLQKLYDVVCIAVNKRL